MWCWIAISNEQYLHQSIDKCCTGGVGRNSQKEGSQSWLQWKGRAVSPHYIVCCLSHTFVECFLFAMFRLIYCAQFLLLRIYVTSTIYQSLVSSGWLLVCCGSLNYWLYMYVLNAASPCFWYRCSTHPTKSGGVCIRRLGQSGAWLGDFQAQTIESLYWMAG